MPYGIPGETPEITAKMERCVEKVMRQGKSKVSAIKICKHQIMLGMARNKLLKKKKS